jgi:hypothetical protein
VKNINAQKYRDFAIGEVVIVRLFEPGSWRLYGKYRTVKITHLLSSGCYYYHAIDINLAIDTKCLVFRFSLNNLHIAKYSG